MRQDSKVKIAAFDTAVRGLLKNKDKYPDRTARNILEMGVVLFRRSIKDEEKKMIIKKIKKMLPRGEESILEYVKDFFLLHE